MKKTHLSPRTMTIGALALLFAAAGTVVGFASRRSTDGTTTLAGRKTVVSTNGAANAANNDPLPSGAVSPPAQSVKNDGGVILEYRATTTDAANTQKRFAFKVNRTPTASAIAAIYSSTGASSSSKATIMDATQSATGILGGDEKDPVQGATEAYKFSGPSTVKPGAGNFYPFSFTVNEFETSATASGGVGGGPGQPQSTVKAQLAAAATVELVNTASSKTPLETDDILRTGSAFRDNTYFRVTRNDTSATTFDTCVRNEEGGAGGLSIGYANATYTITLVQPGFLQQTTTRDVVNQEFVAVGTTGPILPISIALTFGDANGDNAITAADIAIINGYVGTTSSSSNWYDTVPNTAIVGGYLPILIRDLDENQDGAITSADVSAVSANLPTP